MTRVQTLSDETPSKPDEAPDVEGAAPDVDGAAGETDSPPGGGRLTWISLVLVIVGAAVLLYASGFQLSKNQEAGSSASPAKPADAPAIGGPFALIDQDGKAVTDKDYRGKFLLIYFGYTFCPDVCPTTLTEMSDALDLLGDDGDKVTPMLITIDPARDTAEHLKEYATYFHPRLRALTGTAEQIAAAAKAYRVYFAKAKMEEGGDPEDYLMDHSSVTYLMGPDGAFRIHFGHGTDAETMAARIREQL